MRRQVRAFLTALIMLFTAVFAWGFEPVEAHADGGVVIKLHYHRGDGDYAPWSVWFWEDGKDGADYPFADEDGEKVATIELSAGCMKVGFIVRTQAWDKDISEDQFIDISEMISGTVHAYVEAGVKGATKTYGDDAVKGIKLKTAKYDGETTITVTMTSEIDKDMNDAFKVFGKSGDAKIKNVAYEGDYVYTLSLESKLEETKSYSITYDNTEYNVNMPIIYSTDAFEAKYTYSGNDLGATWTKDKTTFKLWAPTAEQAFVNLYKEGKEGVNDLIESVPMTAAENGTWVLEKEGDLNGTYYTYTVTIDGTNREACDPYARTTGVNGARAMVIDLDSTDPEGWDKDKNPHAGENITDAIIYEAHIRDLTTEEGAGITNVGKFLGVVETGTANSDGIATGLDHIKDLGVTHLHILPFYDFGSVDETKVVTGKYNWGYDPVNYNVPEGSYATDAYNGAVRVKEVKEMVKGLHDNGISVVMDVVYNHVQNASSYCFNVLVPGYFSRISETGVYSSGSGCGNDTASERSMVKKYIVESVCYWANEYHIDGFRFDLVGLLDTDTINEIITEVHKTRPDVIFYGEGWTMTTLVTKDNVTLATQTNSTEVPEFAFFNDTIRDALKGSVFDKKPGFVSGAQGQESKIIRCFKGADTWCKSPSQTINYASCHDNNTLFDRITLSVSDVSREDIIRMNNLAAAIYMTSEGVPFMQAGEEILRSKVNSDGTFNENSYASGDSVNSILYSSLADESTKAVYDYYKGLIEFRKAHKALRLSSAEEVKQYVGGIDFYESNIVGFDIDGSVEGEASDRIYVLFNANPEDKVVDLPAGDWKVCINDAKAGTETIETVSGSATVKGISALVLIQGDNGSAKANVGKASTGRPGLIAGISGGILVIVATIAAIVLKNRKKK